MAGSEQSTQDTTNTGKQLTTLQTQQVQPAIRAFPAVSSPPHADPPLSLYNPPAFNRVASLGGRPSINHAANFTSGDFGCWLQTGQDSPGCHRIAHSHKALPRTLKCRTTAASTSSSGGDTPSDASSMAEGNDAVMVTLSPLVVAQAAAEAAARVGHRTPTDKTVPLDGAEEQPAADCLEAALSGGLSSILYRTPETSPLPSPRMGPLYNMFSESTTVSPMLSPIRTTRW